jgi:hypothetical protein
MGLVLLIVGLIVMFLVHWTIGLVLAIIGAVLVLAAALGHSRYW